MSAHYFKGECSFQMLLSSHSSRVGFEIKKVLCRATSIENCMKSIQIRDKPYHKKEQPEYKSFVSSGCLYCVGIAKARVEVFERNPGAW